MRRKRLALALAIVLGVLAAFLVAGFAVLELSPRDYRLVWMLKRTRKIEYSSPFARSTVLEIVKPDEVAEIVSAVTSKLNRRKKGVARVYGAQLRFVLDDGRDLTLATLPFSYARGAPELDEDARASLYVASAVRLPGAADIDEYETDGRALRAVHQRRLNEIQEHGDEIGRLVVDGREVTVEVRQRRSWEGSILRFVPDGVINRANRVSWELVTRRGTRLVGNRTTELLDDDLARVDVSFAAPIVVTAQLSAIEVVDAASTVSVVTVSDPLQLAIRPRLDGTIAVLGMSVSDDNTAASLVPLSGWTTTANADGTTTITWAVTDEWQVAHATLLGRTITVYVSTRLTPTTSRRLAS
ncbi:hypothetical protein HY251_10065, partial [bacterium]|nr:hypothetical protein [bacterium]